MKGERRTHKFTIVLSAEDHRKLQELAAAEGLPMATYLRRLIRAEHKRVFLVKRKGSA